MITFTLYPPTDPECLGTPVAQSSATLFDNGVSASAPAPGPSPGVYRWVAAYSGDDANEPVSSRCGDAAAAVLVLAQSVSKDACRHDGWKALVDSAGQSFKNQGDCRKATEIW